ncbi:hypothetical protein [Streptomyces sp. NPDC127112]
MAGRTGRTGGTGIEDICGSAAEFTLADEDEDEEVELPPST